MKDRLLKYFKSDRHLWWTITVIPGVYSILYLYTNNYTLVNSWYQLVMCILAFVLLPVIEILILDFIFKKWLEKWRPQLYWSYLIINFAILLSLTIYLGWRWKALIVIAIVAVASSLLFARHYKKLVLLIGFMTLVASYQFIHFYIERVVSREDWVQQMEFENLKFQQKPNIYLIQPDGFVGQAASQNSYYNLDLDSFYKTLEVNGFETTATYRSNYPSTLTSNTTLFTGQHHYFENGNLENELFGAREIIVGGNPVLNTLKRNGYESNLILQHAYLIMNFPNLGYDRVNIKNSEVSAPIPDYYLNKDVILDLEKSINTQNDQPQFYFIELLEPGHIPGNTPPEAKREEAEKYRKGLYDTTHKLSKMIGLIDEKDPNALIIIAADHGGFVGLSNTEEAFQALLKEAALKQSIYSSLLAIKAPNDFRPFQENIKSSIGVFPNLFAYLADKPVPKNTLDNSSYIFIKEGEARGIYKYFNTYGEPVTEKVPLK